MPEINKIIRLVDVKDVNPIKAHDFSEKLSNWQHQNNHLPPEQCHKNKMKFIKKLEQEIKI